MNKKITLCNKILFIQHEHILGAKQLYLYFYRIVLIIIVNFNLFRVSLVFFISYLTLFVEL